MSARDPDKTGRSHWLWVTRPEYYLEEDGSERDILEPNRGYEAGGWWTCHKDTEDGDLVLLYRTSPKKDIAYLIETRSAAYPLLDDEAATDQGFVYGCDFEVIEHFSSPMTLDEIRRDPALATWGAFRRNFLGTAFRIEPDIWDHLIDRLTSDRQKLESRRREARHLVTLEREIEEKLAEDLTVFDTLGFDLRLQGRQHVCRNGGRADLICFDRKAERLVVIELKRGQVGRHAVGQVLSYRASIESEFPQRRRPLALVVGGRIDAEATGMIGADERLEFVQLETLGFA
jgi:hypothetical protein